MVGFAALTATLRGASGFSDGVGRGFRMGGGECRRHAAGMPECRRLWVPGGTYAFTVNLADRSRRLLSERFDVLHDATCVVRRRHAFEIVAWVVMPNHLHAVWTLPDGDHDFALRWMLIKQRFSRAMPAHERITASRLRKGERGIWQRRYWERLVRNERDMQNCIDYIHFNPVKHGMAARVVDWPYSSFHRFVLNGWLPEDWAGSPDADS
jgi:putative transposase